MSSFVVSCTRAIRIGMRRPLNTLNPIAFFIMVVSLMSLVLVRVPVELRDELAIAILWVVNLLATMLTSGSAFIQDFEDGTLELLIAQQPFLYPSVQGTFVAHWLLQSVPLIVVSPLAAWMLDLSAALLPMVVLTLVAGSFVFTQFGMLGASFSLGTGRGGLFVALLVLPLYVPVLLLGVGACQQLARNDAFEVPLLSVLAISAASVTFVPFAVSAALKISHEY